MAESNNPIYRLARNIRQRIPDNYHRFYYRYLLMIIQFYNIHIRSFLRTRLTLTVFEGKDKSGHFPLTLAYVGGRKQDPEYWAGSFLSPGFKKHVLGKKWVWQVKTVLDRSNHSCCMSIFELTAFTLKMLSKDHDFQTTQWMRMVIDISEPVESTWKKRGDSAEDVLRRIRKNNLSYITSRDPEVFDEFYHKMHIPFITARHKKEAFTADYFTIKEFFLKGFLLFIKRDKDIIAGVIIVPEREKAVLKVLGIKDGKDEYMRLGAICAIYYYSVLEMQKRGYKVLDIGRTRPVFTNGVTKFKFDMRARLVPETSLFRDHTLIKFTQNTPGLRNFLIHNPYLYYKKHNQACRALFVKSGQFGNKEDFDKYFMSYNCKGLKGTSVFVFGDPDKITDWVRSLNYKNTTVGPAEALFPDKNVREPKEVCCKDSNLIVNNDHDHKEVVEGLARYQTAKGKS